MLRSRADFARLAAGGRTRSDRLIVLHFVANDLDHDRYGISTGRRLGAAVQRNRVRRRVREVLRASPNHSGHGWDILVVARTASVEATFDELSTALGRLLASVRASVMATP